MQDLNAFSRSLEDIGIPLLGISGARTPEQHGGVREGLAMGTDSVGCRFSGDSDGLELSATERRKEV